MASLHMNYSYSYTKYDSTTRTGTPGTTKILNGPFSGDFLYG